MEAALNHSKYRLKPGSKLDLSQRYSADKSALPGGSKENAVQLLAQLSKDIDRLQDLLFAQQKHAVLVVLQGMDTSGKDGVVRHVFSETDPLGVRAVGFKAPTAAELAHDFLWRVHREVPGKGEIVVFNRSHYEDVLVVRVHKWIGMETRKERYRQINEFERCLAENGTLILKFFLHLSRDEQKKRLQERVDDPDKRWKFNPRDLEERKFWGDYMSAHEDALTATSTQWAPWYIVPANSKTNRNIVVSSILKEALAGLDMSYPQPEWDPATIRVT
ncbi:MAG: polyphosphate kinase 2 family protein [Betaproteobacteria bacterium]|nr:polyphosphate kinase 2 family protein [Betaproteobacteria bacterium]